MGSDAKVLAVVWDGQALSDGRTLGYSGNPVLAAGTQFALVAGIGVGWTDTSLFLGDGASLRPIIRSKGPGFGTGKPGPGGGDPTPIGGTFCGVGAVSANKHGDLLFLADVRDGSSKRALFLYRAQSEDIVKVVAVGERSPSGTTYTHLGQSHLNDRGQVAFMAIAGSNSLDDAALFKWEGGNTVVVFRPHDPAPGGGVVDTVSFGSPVLRDGTFVPSGGGLGADGTVVCELATNGDTWRFESIIGVWKDGQASAPIRQGDSAPDGGSFEWVQWPLVNGRGDLAFFAYTSPSTGGWYLNSGKQTRKLLVWGTNVEQKPVHGLGEAAISSNGDVLVWASTRLWDDRDAGHDYLLRVRDKRWTVAVRTETSIPKLGTLTGLYSIVTQNGKIASFQVGVEDKSSSDSKGAGCVVRLAPPTRRR